jgi:hypothetical protein
MPCPGGSCRSSFFQAGQGIFLVGFLFFGFLLVSAAGLYCVYKSITSEYQELLPAVQAEERKINFHLLGGQTVLSGRYHGHPFRFTYEDQITGRACIVLDAPVHEFAFLNGPHLANALAVSSTSLSGINSVGTDILAIELKFDYGAHPFLLASNRQSARLNRTMKRLMTPLLEQARPGIRVSMVSHDPFDPEAFNHRLAALSALAEDEKLQRKMAEITRS